MDARNEMSTRENGPASVDTAAVFDAARLVRTFGDAQRAMASSGALRAFAGSPAPDGAIDQLRQVLGEDSQLVDDFLAAKATLSNAVLARSVQLQRAAQEELQLLLREGARFAGDDWYLLDEFGGGEVKAKVLSIESVRLLDDGSLWGYVRVSIPERAALTWEFAWRDQRLSVCARDF